MAQAQLQEELIPAGGIADFVMSDAEIAALESEEATEQFGNSGIARFEPIAKRMASYGRYGDDQVVHAETGELLVPRALIEGNPELKESIFSHLREMGIEDPDRYVVGSSANSINPDTGMPEFFFKSIRRAVSKVAKGVSKAVSKVGKVLKKVAPVVLPIALAMTPLGAMYGAALGSGIGTLIQGGNIKDALKSALVSGAVGGITAGFTGNTGSFMGNVKAAAANPLGRLSQTGAGISEAFKTGSIGKAFQSYTPGIEGADIPEGTNMDQLIGREGTTPADVQQAAMRPSNNLADANLYGEAYGTNIPAQPNVTGGNFPEAELYNQAYGGTPTQTGQGVTTGAKGATDSGFFDTLSEYGTKAKNLYGEYISPSRGMPTTADINAAAAKIQQDAAAKGLKLTSEQAIQQATSNLTPNLIARYAPIGALTAAGAAAAGFFDAAPQEDPNLVDRRTGADLLAENPDEYMVGGRTPTYATGPTTVETQYGLPSGGQVYQNPFARPRPVYGDARDYRVFMPPQMYAAAGGEVYPRRNGGIMPNEGIPDQDSVRALLMPGEFVMTKDAVRGLGGGNLNQGINNMYSMMRNLETKGQVA